MPGNTSFNYAIFQRLQAAYVAGISTATGFHMDPVNPGGGFCLLYPQHGARVDFRLARRTVECL
jgi:hypothetical protein